MNIPAVTPHDLTDADAMASRPAVVDGEVVWLPNLVGILHGKSVITPVEGRTSLWTTLASSVIADAAFDEIDSELARESGFLADVIDLDAHRR